MGVGVGGTAAGMVGGGGVYWAGVDLVGQLHQHQGCCNLFHFRLAINIYLDTRMDHAELFAVSHPEKN